MNYRTYKVNGINVQTNRKKSFKVDAITEDIAIQIALDNGIKDIQSIEILPPEPATESQIEYAKSLGIPIPIDSTKEDLSAILSKKLDKDGSPNEGLIEFATNKHILFSKHIGKTALYNRIFYDLAVADRIAFLAFCIYRYISDDRHANLDTHPNRERFYSFADTVIDDENFLKSMNRYSGADIKFFGTLTGADGWTYTGGSVDTIAFKMARSYLIEQGLIEESDRYRSKILKTTNQPRAYETTNQEQLFSPTKADKPKLEIPKYELPAVIGILILLALYIFIF